MKLLLPPASGQANRRERNDWCPNNQLKRKIIFENWASKCTFTDAPGARFETTGPPEKWLAKAVEKARPPLRSIVADVTDEETTTSFVINKEVLDDPPIGTIEIEGTGVVTITPGIGEE